MARRGSKKSANPAQLALIVGILVVLLGIYLIVTNRHDNADDRLSLQTFPIDDYMSRGSILRDNKYTIRGRVEEIFHGNKGELISLAVKTKNRTDELLPVFLPSGRKTINIERNGEYVFTVRVVNENQELGIIMTESVANAD